VIEYEVECRRVRGLDDLLIKVEIGDSQQFEDVRVALLGKCRAELNIRVNVEQAEPGSLPRYEFKARRYKRVT
jgi:phenylacetate-coenzyme A ligase PaaK-like adenylate-forming protein